MPVTTPGQFPVFVPPAPADLCRGVPRLVVRVNGAVVLSRLVRSRSWQLARVLLRHRLIRRSVSVAYRGEYANAGCDRNLRIDTIALSRG